MLVVKDVYRIKSQEERNKAISRILIRLLKSRQQSKQA